MKKASFLTQPLFLLGISLFIYIMALSLPALTFEIIEPKTIHTGSTYIMKGIEVTIGGILGLLFLQAPAIGWLANPLYWYSCNFFVQKKYKFSIASAFCSIIVGFTGTISTYWFALPNGSNPDSQPLLIKLLPGFWLWLAAPAFVMIIASGFTYTKHKNRLQIKSVKLP
ncbi:hypothetical protein [Nostoc sp. UIC 10630]|uniref:hypothetical protein n=1 Tax=Nostoc sp. UIC 10630 TaxID=2100146 RepID=UPI0013CF697D|nr:hypothetical protein [Nostoc sp. UIC 10630]NEU80311.1 hypothetical protein [Nostoc sp. UIC 10630]